MITNRRLVAMASAGLLVFAFTVVVMVHKRDETFFNYLSSIRFQTCSDESNKKSDEASTAIKDETIKQETIAAASPEEVDWRKIDSAQMSASQIVDYLHFTNRSSCKLIHDFGGVMLKYNNVIPGLDGQKALCLEPGKAPIENKCVVYSFGINNEWSFDTLMENFGCQVFAFDPTMGKPDHDRSKAIHFYNLGLGGSDGTKNGWKIQSLSSIYEMLVKNGKHSSDAVIDYLKIDIEFDEWIALPQILSSGMIRKVRQMGIEFHLPRDSSLNNYRSLMAIIKGIEDSGMIRFDSKYNPWFMDYVPALDYKGSRGFEIAWYRFL